MNFWNIMHDLLIDEQKNWSEKNIYIFSISWPKRWIYTFVWVNISKLISTYSRFIDNVWYNYYTIYITLF